MFESARRCADAVVGRVAGHRRGGVDGESADWVAVEPAVVDAAAGFPRPVVADDGVDQGQVSQVPDPATPK